MTKLWKYIQYGYLVVVAILIVEGALRFNSNRNSAYLSFGFAIFILILFFVKRKFRRKIEERNNRSKQS